MVRVAVLGLFFISALAGCGGRQDSGTLARADDLADRTQLYSWLVDHDPSALVAWHVPPARLHAVVPAAHVVAATSANPCAQAARLHAALVLVMRDAAAADRDRALDCGIALFRDAGGLVIAPR